jgi:hypothetical protein
MSIDLGREVTKMIEESQKKQNKVPSGLAEASRRLSDTLKDLRYDLKRFEDKMKESGFNSELGKLMSEIKRELESLFR